MADWPYNSQQWRRLRKHKLAESPLCERCLPSVVPAVAVDHRTPISRGGDPFPSLAGLASLCVSCHSVKTAEDQGRARPMIDAATGKPVGRDGWW